MKWKEAFEEEQRALQGDKAQFVDSDRVNIS
jgi:hypothetical protein